MKVQTSIVPTRKRVPFLAVLLVLIAGAAAWGQEAKGKEEEKNAKPQAVGTEASGAQPSEAKPTGAPAVAQPILKLDEVKVGMKGYGLTVFHGAKIEPFAVEVVSVMRDFAPQRGVVWIRCDDERLQKTGPVSGMSGSPIFLWDEKEAKEIGKGGKLIGAFAFGFGWTKDCYAGVQPIENMRKTGDAIAGDAAKPAAKRTAQPGATIADLLRAGQEWKLDERDMWKAQAFAKVVRLEEGRAEGHGARAAGQAGA